jgi:acyl-CoA reductase-like NAD-dependent aldehyde dehydrogenase
VTSTSLVELPGLGPQGEYRSRAREVITDTSGTPVAEVSIAPPLFIARTMAGQRKIQPLPRDRRLDALGVAAELFTCSAVAGLGFDEYVELASGVSGLPVAVTRAQALEVADAVRSPLDAISPARPIGAVLDWREARPGQGVAVWSRRGEVFGVHASGNAPGIHGLWPQALALGYRVAVRPSRREPFTAHRIISCLREAGFRYDDATYLPTDHRGADEIIRSADLAMVYGGGDVVAKYGGDPKVFVNGPGRTKILLTAEQDWREYLDVIVDSIGRLGGMACVNATAVLYEGDPAPLAQAIAQALSAIELLPAQPVELAHSMAGYLAARAAGAVPVLGADQVVGDLGDGRATLRPAVHLLDRPVADTLNTELPFPCVWVSRWSRTDGIAPLRNSLVVNAITRDEGLIDDLLGEPTIANVYSGEITTCFTAPELPHDGFLAEFLMRTKGFVRD